MKRYKQLQKANRQFPSPYGDFVFQRERCIMEKNIMENGFRPLTGILFFNSKDKDVDLFIEKFPSPYGDFVFQPIVESMIALYEEGRFRPLTGILFFNDSTQVLKNLDAVEAFPSPYGDFVFQRGLLVLLKRWRALVSVPLRGFCFSTLFHSESFLSCRRRVSVPLRGFCFSTRARCHLQFHVPVVSVPLRGFCFSTCWTRWWSLLVLHFVSVPLRGFCFSTGGCVYVYKTGQQRVSVPLRGFCFSTSGRASTIIREYGAFPSPYGDFVFQHPTKGRIYDRRRAASFRPLTGILFFNKYDPVGLQSR